MFPATHSTATGQKYATQSAVDNTDSPNECPDYDIKQSDGKAIA